MKFTIEHAFVKGDTHTVCEDYATSAQIHGLDLSVPFNPLAIVSDGCSSATDSDVGARLIALNARRVLTQQIIDGKIAPIPEIGDQIYRMMITNCADLDLPPSCCTATLLAAFVLDGMAHVIAYGDGYWYKRTHNGQLSFTSIHQPDETPPYLVHRFDNREPEVCVISEYPSGAQSESTATEFHWSFPVTEVSEFGVCTDGLGSSDREPQDILNDLTGGSLPYLMDQFLQSRPGLYDDLGIASIRIS